MTFVKIKMPFGNGEITIIKTNPDEKISLKAAIPVISNVAKMFLNSRNTKLSLPFKK